MKKIPKILFHDGLIRGGVIVDKNTYSWCNGSMWFAFINFPKKISI